MNKKPNKKINVKYNFNLSELNNLDILNSNLNELVSRQTEKAVKKLSKIESKYLTDIVAEICGDCVVVYFKCHNLTILTFYLAVKTVLKTSTNYIYIDSVRVTPNSTSWKTAIEGIQYELGVFERGVDNLDIVDKVKFFEAMKGDK